MKGKHHLFFAGMTMIRHLCMRNMCAYSWQETERFIFTGPFCGVVRHKRVTILTNPMNPPKPLINVITHFLEAKNLPFLWPKMGGSRSFSGWPWVRALTMAPNHWLQAASWRCPLARPTDLLSSLRMSLGARGPVVFNDIGIYHQPSST